MSSYTVTLKPGARDQLKSLDLQVRAALSEAILDLQFGLPGNGEADEVDKQRFSLYLPPLANGLRPFLVFRVTPKNPPNGSLGDVTVITVAQYAAPTMTLPAVTPPAIDPPATPPQPSKYMVYDVLVKYLSKDELAQLIFELGRDIADLDGENLEGDTKEELARELIQFVTRRNVLDKLVARLKASRPDIREL